MRIAEMKNPWLRRPLLVLFYPVDTLLMLLGCTAEGLRLFILDQIDFFKRVKRAW